ncbi:PilZ domain-containing protein [bacterium]|nr:PilZ domain-containing protein [bacterium]
MTGSINSRLVIGSQVCLRLEELHPKGRMEIPNGEVSNIEEDGIYIHIPVIDSKYLEGRRVDILWEKGMSIYCLSSKISKCIQKEDTMLVINPSDTLRSIDKRRYVRLKKPIRIEFRPTGNDGLFISAEGKDVSGGGVRFFSRYPLELGQNIEILIEVPIFPYLDTTAYGEVVRMERLKNAEGCQVGVRFLEMDHIGRKRLFKYILDEQQPLSLKDEKLMESLRLWFALC